MPAELEAAAFAYSCSEQAKLTRKALPASTQAVIFDVLDDLAARPDAFAERTRELVEGSGILVYSHPDPPLEITYQLLRGERQLRVLHFAAPAFHAVKPVFISYSHRDAAWVDKVTKVLRTLDEQGLIRLWDDRRIEAGADWLVEIRKALEAARVAILLVSQDFLASKFIQSVELPALLDAATRRGTKIFWFPVSASSVEGTALARYQAALPLDVPLDALPESKQEEALAALSEALRRAVEPRQLN